MSNVWCLARAAERENVDIARMIPISSCAGAIKDGGLARKVVLQVRAKSIKQILLLS